MAIEHFYTGPVLVTFNSVQLGYTRDGVRVRIEPKFADIHSDDWGGAGGAPADTQLLGAVASCVCDLTKYSKADVDALTAYVKSGTKATLPAFGTLIRQESKYATLLLDGTQEERSFAMAFIRGAHEYNAGTRARVYNISFEMHLDATTTRVLFTDSGSPS